jgi:hypothetical protein
LNRRADNPRSTCTGPLRNHRTRSARWNPLETSRRLACEHRAELDLRNGQQFGEASLAMSRTSDKIRASLQHFEQLADTLQQSTKDVADLLRGTQEAGRRLEIAVYVAIGITVVQFFNLIFEIFRKHR